MTFGATNEDSAVDEWQGRTVQSKRRIVLDRDYMEQLGISVGDRVIVTCEDDEIRIMPKGDKALEEVTEG